MLLKLYFVFVLLSVTILESVVLPAHAVRVTLLTTVPGVSVNNSFDAVIGISGLSAGTGPSLGAFDIDLESDTLLLQVVDISFCNQLEILGLSSLQSSAVTANGVNLYEASLDLTSDLDSFQSDSFSLAVVRFLASGAGQRSLLLSINSLGNFKGDPLSELVTDSRIHPQDPNGDGSGGGGNTPPTDVPEPSTLAIFGGAIQLLAA